MKRKQQVRRKKTQTNNPIGLFILYLRERGYKKKNSTTFEHPKTGDAVVIEYIRGRAAMYHCADSGLAHVIWYTECPLPQQTQEWWERIQKRKHQKRGGRKDGRRNRGSGSYRDHRPGGPNINNSLAVAMRAAKKEEEKHRGEK